MATGRTTEPFRDVAAAIRSQITTRELMPGMRLPNARELATQYGVAVTTAVRAVGLLRDEGLVVTTHGRGSYVAARHEIMRGDTTRYVSPDPVLAPNRTEAAQEGFQDEVDLSDRSTDRAGADVAERLGIDEGDDVSVVRYRWRVGGIPTQISLQWEPLAITQGTSAEVPAPKTRGAPAGHARMAEIGWKGSRVVEDYRARLPTREEAELLEIQGSAPVLVATRISYATKDDEERAVETADIVMRGDRMVIRSERNTATDVEGA